MSRSPSATPWRTALALAACVAVTVISATPAHASSSDGAEGPGHVPPASAPSVPSASDPLAPRGLTLGVSATTASAELGDDVVARLAVGTGSISGVVDQLVDYAVSVPLQGATITAHTYDSGNNTLSGPLATATSASDGTYTLTGLNTGSYVVLVQDQASGSELLPDFYPNAAYASQADAVVVTDGQNSAGIDEVLAPLLSDYIAGASRYETSAAIAAGFPENVDCVYLASGADFPDALSAAPAAATCGGPLLLVAPTAVPSAIEAELGRLSPANILIAGGTGAVSAGVESAVKQIVADAVVQRLAGSDRFATSRAIVDHAFGETGGSGGFAWIATGMNFPDALSASNEAAAYGEPVLIVPGTAPSLDGATMTTIAGLEPDAVLIAGGTGVVSTSIQAQLAQQYATDRLAGADRYATSLVINEFNWSTPDGATSVYAFVTNGTNFPDALSGAALAGGRWGAPLYAVPPTCVPDSVQQHIAALHVYETYLLGYFSEISFDEPLKHC